MNNKLRLIISYTLLVLSGIFSGLGYVILYSILDWVCFFSGMILLLTSPKEQNKDFYLISVIVVWATSFLITSFIIKGHL